VQLLGKGIFITGTDTGVGKTVVSAVLIRSLIRKGIRTGAMKPFETGCVNENGELCPQDGMFLKSVAGMDDPLELVTPVRYALPLAPMVASNLERRPVDLSSAFSAFRTLSGRYDAIVVEGVGGLLVPVARPTTGAPAYYVSDLIRSLALPVVIVTRPTLGTINHTLLTVYQALREGLDVIGIIINEHAPPGNSVAERTNPMIIEKLSPVPVLGIVPHLPEVTEDTVDAVAARAPLFLDPVFQACLTQPYDRLL